MQLLQLESRVSRMIFISPVSISLAIIWYDGRAQSQHLIQMCNTQLFWLFFLLHTFLRKFRRTWSWTWYPGRNTDQRLTVITNVSYQTVILYLRLCNSVGTDKCADWCTPSGALLNVYVCFYLFIICRSRRITPASLSLVFCSGFPRYVSLFIPANV